MLSPKPDDVKPLLQCAVKYFPEEQRKKINQQARGKGQTYVGWSGKIIPAKTPGLPCKCRKDCYSVINQKTRDELFKKYYDLPNYNEQTSYLCKLICIDEINTTVKRKKYLYYIPIEIGREGVCQRAFVNIFGLSKPRIEMLQKRLKVQSFEDKRGKQERPTHFAYKIILINLVLILQYPDITCRFLRNDGQLCVNIFFRFLKKKVNHPKFNAHQIHRFMTREFGSSDLKIVREELKDKKDSLFTKYSANQEELKVSGQNIEKDVLDFFTDAGCNEDADDLNSDKGDQSSQKSLKPSCEVPSVEESEVISNERIMKPENEYLNCHHNLDEIVTLPNQEYEKLANQCINNLENELTQVIGHDENHDSIEHVDELIRKKVKEKKLVVEESENSNELIETDLKDESGSKFSSPSDRKRKRKNKTINVENESIVDICDEDKHISTSPPKRKKLKKSKPPENDDNYRTIGNEEYVDTSTTFKNKKDFNSEDIDARDETMKTSERKKRKKNIESESLVDACNDDQTLKNEDTYNSTSTPKSKKHKKSRETEADDEFTSIPERRKRKKNKYAENDDKYAEDILIITSPSNNKSYKKTEHTEDNDEINSTSERMKSGKIKKISNPDQQFDNDDEDKHTSPRVSKIKKHEHKKIKMAYVLSKDACVDNQEFVNEEEYDEDKHKSSTSKIKKHKKNKKINIEKEICLDICEEDQQWDNDDYDKDKHTYKKHKKSKHKNANNEFPGSKKQKMINVENESLVTVSNNDHQLEKNEKRIEDNYNLTSKPKRKKHKKSRDTEADDEFTSIPEEKCDEYEHNPSTPTIKKHEKNKKINIEKEICLNTCEQWNNDDYDKYKHNSTRLSKSKKHKKDKKSKIDFKLTKNGSAENQELEEVEKCDDSKDTLISMPKIKKHKTSKHSNADNEFPGTAEREKIYDDHQLEKNEKRIDDKQISTSHSKKYKEPKHTEDNDKVPSTFKRKKTKNNKKISIETQIDVNHRFESNENKHTSPSKSKKHMKSKHTVSVEEFNTNTEIEHDKEIEKLIERKHRNNHNRKETDRFSPDVHADCKKWINEQIEHTSYSTDPCSIADNEPCRGNIEIKRKKQKKLKEINKFIAMDSNNQSGENCVEYKRKTRKLHVKEDIENELLTYVCNDSQDSGIVDHTSVSTRPFFTENSKQRKKSIIKYELGVVDHSKGKDRLKIEDDFQMNTIDDNIHVEDFGEHVESYHRSKNKKHKRKKIEKELLANTIEENDAEASSQSVVSKKYNREKASTIVDNNQVECNEKYVEPEFYDRIMKEKSKKHKRKKIESDLLTNFTIDQVENEAIDTSLFESIQKKKRMKKITRNINELYR